MDDEKQKELNFEEKPKDPIWALPEESKFKFYNALSICGIVVFLVTMFSKWCGWFWTAILDIFNDIGKGIFSSVVIVWFVFQVVDWIQPRFDRFKAVIFNKISKMGWGDPYREKVRKEGHQEGRQEGRQEERERFVEFLEKEKAPQEIIRNARKFFDSSSKDR